VNARQLATTMKAIVQDGYGSPDVLHVAEVQMPEVKDGEVVVQVRAASVNVVDWVTLTGRPYIVRPALGGVRRPRTSVRGQDVAGAVVAVGNDVKRLRPGDEVFGWCDVTFAEDACAAESSFVHKPVGLTFEQAAAIPVTAATALKNLRDVGRIRQGQRVLINGAAGGVGTFGVQIAKWLGAEVTGVCSTRNVDLVRSLGADQVIDYTREDFTSGGRRYDLILDNVMNHSSSDCRRVLTPNGMLILNNGTSGGRWFGTIGRMAGAMLMSRFVDQQLRVASLPRVEDLPLIKQLVDEGKLRPVIDQTFPLGETAEALRYLGAGHARGKVIITV